MTQPLDDVHRSIEHTFVLQKQRSLDLRTENISGRRHRLNLLKKWIKSNRHAIQQAGYNDFRKAASEIDAIEIFHVLSEIKLAVDSLEDWTSSRMIDAPLTMIGTRSVIQYEPKGVCLIISPWNYPFSLAIGPLVSALAAGNTAIIKPSEMTPNMSTVIKRMVNELFDERDVEVFEGDASVAQKLLSLPFDHIFFTGSPQVGKLVMTAAAEHLTSVTLELGGKCPCIIDDDADLDEAAERVAVAKFVNNGQTCIAPDYVLASGRIAKSFAERVAFHTRSLFGGSDGNVSTSRDYCRVVNEHHFDRLTGLMQEAAGAGVTVCLEGVNNREERFFHPVVLLGVSLESRLMNEEIFGPILPIVEFRDVTEAVALVNARPKPLALYIFSRRKATQERIRTETSSGGICINDCAIHFLNNRLPFGGVNHSGLGKSHGHYGFLAFSNEKPVLKQRAGLTSVKSFYPPYSDTKRKLMDWFLKLF